MGNYYSGMMNATGGSELRHHGILGQKWGVRRFQNADGSLTEEGKKRYGSGYKGFHTEAQEMVSNFNKNALKKGLTDADFDAMDANVLNRYDKAIKDGADNLGELNGDERYKLNNYVRNLCGKNYDKKINVSDDIRKEEGLTAETIGEEMEDGIAREIAKRHYDKYNGNGAADSLKSNTDFRWRSKNKEDKEAKELAILKLNDAETQEDFEKDPELVKAYVNLQHRIEIESGDWYNSKPVTSAFQKIYDSHERPRQEADKMESDAYDSARNKYTKRLSELKSQYEHTKSSHDKKRYDDMYNEMWDAINKAQEKVQKSEKYKSLIQKSNSYADSDKLASVVLRDIGYEDTSEARRLIQYMIFWD